MPHACSLPSELTIYTVGELYPQCLAWLDAGAADLDGLQVDAQAVVEVDAAGVQLLMSLSNALVARQCQLHLVSPSEPLSAACQALGAGGLVKHVELTGQVQ
jgi:anti-anti-sigma regulatory factor